MACESEFGNQKGNEDDRAQLQDTVPLDSPTEESEFCNIDLDTELQCDSDRGGGGEKTTEPPCEYEEEIVLDSEDEEINGSRVVAVTKSLPDKEIEKKSEQRCAGIIFTNFIFYKIIIRLFWVSYTLHFTFVKSIYHAFWILYTS